MVSQGQLGHRLDCYCLHTTCRLFGRQFRQQRCSLWLPAASACTNQRQRLFCFEFPLFLHSGSHWNLFSS